MCDLNTNRCGKTAVGFVRPAESGVYLPLLASGVFVLLIVIGLAIDSARLYRAKIEVQQIVDAAALASARILVNSPSATLAGDAPRVYNDSLQLVGSNLLAAGYSPIAVADLRDRREGQSINTCLGLNGTCCYVPTQPFMCAGEPSEERRYVEVSMRLRIPTLILGILPGFREGNYVSARGIIENLRMQTVLVLDQSGSMDENWSGQTKGQFLKTAAKAFVDTLLPFDELAIVAFSANVNGQSDQTVALSTSGGREPQADPGASNPTDGWEITMNRLRSNYANDSQRIFPTTQQSLVQVGDGTVKGAAKDAIDALVFGGNTDIGSGIWRANTLLDNAGGGDANILKLIVVVTDGAPNGSISNYLPITWWNVGERPRGALSDDMCENHPLWTTLLSYSTSSNATTQNNRRQRLRALDAIIESDLSRENGYVVYSIGVGQEDSNLLSPFQNIGNLNGLKRFLLRRIANDQSAMRLAQPFPDPEVFTPLDPTYPWDFPCVPQGAAIAMKPRGQYLLANSGPALIAAFREVASVRSRFQQ